MRLNGATTDILVKLLLKQMNQKDFFPNKKTKGNFVLTAQYCFKNGPQTGENIFCQPLRFTKKIVDSFFLSFFPFLFNFLLLSLIQDSDDVQKLGLNVPKKHRKVAKTFFNLASGKFSSMFTVSEGVCNP